MGWICILYEGFSKKVNSTKQPTGGTQYDCRIKNDTDFKNPVLEIYAEDLSGVNYMQFNGEYFYVVSVVSHRNNIWDVAGQRDPLATYKSAIASTQAFMLYGFGDDVSDTSRRVPDERLAVKRVPQTAQTQVAIQGGNVVFSPSAGCFVLSAVGSNGGVASYAVTPGSMYSLLNTLGQDALDKVRLAFNYVATPSDETEALTFIRNGLCDTMANELAFGNAIQAIRDCHWLPFLAASGTGSEIMLGDFHSGAFGLKLGQGDLVKTDSFSVQIPWPVDDWKRMNCQVQLYLPMCGVVPLPVDKINGSAFATVQIAVDYLGGTVSYLVQCGGIVINVSGCNSAVPYAIGSSNVSMQNFISGSLQAVGGGVQAAGGAVSAALTGGILGSENIAGGITSMASGIMTAVTPQIQCSGSVGGCSAIGLYQAIFCDVQYFAPIDEENTEAEYGHPVFSLTSPRNGYNMFRAFSVDCGGSPEEIARINTMFNSGAYYE